jgi:hypothetical protein
MIPFVSERSVDEFVQLGTIQPTGVLGDYLAVLEEKEGRDVSDAETIGEHGILVHVDLADSYLAFVARCGLVKKWSNRLAGAAPNRPEIHQHREIALGHRAVKIIGGEIEDVVACHAVVTGLKSLNTGRSIDLDQRSGDASAVSGAVPTGVLYLQRGSLARKSSDPGTLWYQTRT